MYKRLSQNDTDVYRDWKKIVSADYTGEEDEIICKVTLHDWNIQTRF